jgi:hypothetical protein
MIYQTTAYYPGHLLRHENTPHHGRISSCVAETIRENLPGDAVIFFPIRQVKRRNVGDGLFAETAGQGVVHDYAVDFYVIGYFGLTVTLTTGVVNSLAIFCWRWIGADILPAQYG